MKIRNGFVSNSSSSSFIVKNKTNETKTIKDFAMETSFFIKQFNEIYDYEYTVDEFMSGIDQYRYIWRPGEELEVIFGDEDGVVMGQIYDYMLRKSDYSKSFMWYLKEILR